MLEVLIDVLTDTLTDSVKLLPFLFITYLAMEYLEHAAGDKMFHTIRRSGRSGPLIGSILGAFPQCGFSAAASNLYAGRIITLGTLLSIYLSTSDEMLPILISEKAGAEMIIKILGVKIVIGMLAGFSVDFVIRRFFKENSGELQIEHLCEQHHCHCERGILKSAVHHTLEIFVYVFLISLALNLVISLIGDSFLETLLVNRPVLGVLIAGAVGLIPNCAASVVITQLYLKGVITAGSMAAGLLVGAGVGILVLLRVNDRPKENVRIITLLYLIGITAGIVIETLGIRF